MNKRFLILGVTLLVIVSFAIAYVFWPVNDPDPVVVNRPANKKLPVEKHRGVDPEYVVVGGVRRRASDVRRSATHRREDSSDPTGQRDYKDDYGEVQPVKSETHPHVRAIAKALKTDKGTEQLSPMLPPVRFNLKAYQTNPKSYLAKLEPGRVFTPAQPGPDVPRLRAFGKRSFRVTQGESVKLRVQAPAGSPVSFTSFDLGAFKNHLPAITVQANKQGIAEAEFFGTQGTIADVNILAASPQASEQVRFVVEVQTPSGEGQ